MGSSTISAVYPLLQILPRPPEPPSSGLPMRWPRPIPPFWALARPGRGDRRRPQDCPGGAEARSFPNSASVPAPDSDRGLSAEGRGARGRRNWIWRAILALRSTKSLRKLRVEAAIASSRLTELPRAMDLARFGDIQGLDQSAARPPCDELEGKLGRTCDGCAGSSRSSRSTCPTTASRPSCCCSALVMSASRSRGSSCSGRKSSSPTSCS